MNTDLTQVKDQSLVSYRDRAMVLAKRERFVYRDVYEKDENGEIALVPKKIQLVPTKEYLEGCDHLISIIGNVTDMTRVMALIEQDKINLDIAINCYNNIGDRYLKYIPSTLMDSVTVDFPTIGSFVHYRGIDACIVLIASSVKNATILFKVKEEMRQEEYEELAKYIIAEYSHFKFSQVRYILQNLAKKNLYKNIDGSTIIQAFDEHQTQVDTEVDQAMYNDHLANKHRGENIFNYKAKQAEFSKVQADYFKSQQIEKAK